MERERAQNEDVPFSRCFLCDSVLNGSQAFLQFTLVHFHGWRWVLAKAPELLAHPDLISPSLPCYCYLHSTARLL